MTSEKMGFYDQLDSNYPKTVPKQAKQPTLLPHPGQERAAFVPNWS